MTRLQILKKTSTVAKTKYGPKNKYNLFVRSSKSDFWASAWENKVTKDWREGQEIEVDIETSEYQGKPQYTLRPFERSINEVYDLLLEVKKILVGKGFEKAIEDKEPAMQKDEDYQPDQDNEGDLPF